MGAVRGRHHTLRYEHKLRHEWRDGLPILETYGGRTGLLVIQNLELAALRKQRFAHRHPNLINHNVRERT